MTQRTALIVTYTMSNPEVVGVFFRALRLARELTDRQWRAVICNRGPKPRDPKMSITNEEAELIFLNDPEPDHNGITEHFARYRPDVVVFGEGPFEAMEIFYHAAKSLGRPFVLLDQYYQDDLLTRRSDVDLVLLYGLRPFWRDEPALGGRYRLIPPFIDDVCAKASLPVPSALHSLPWVTVLGFDSGVLRQGIELVASLPAERRPVLICLSHDPEAASRRIVASGFPSRLAVALPLQEDAELFGLMAHSRVTVTANGFMQMMESLALTTPTICIDRKAGFEAWSLAERFVPYISVGEDAQGQRARLSGWLDGSPFAPELAEGLVAERCGARVVANALEELAARSN